MTTTQIKITDKAIAQYGTESNKTHLKDTGSPLYFRYHKSRNMGTFSLVKRIQGKNKWIRLGCYPEISTTTARKALTIALQRLTLKLQQGEFSEVSFNSNNTVSNILTWYLSRNQMTKVLSKHTKKGVKSVIERHLLPKIGHLALKQVSRQTLDKQLFWPLQQQLKPSTIKQVFQILKRAFKSALGVGLINENPMVSISFKELVAMKVTAKASRLTVIDLPKIFKQVEQSPSSVKTLTLLMLLFATRVGETSQAKWSDFDRRNNLWRLPGDNTKTKQAHRLPMTVLVWKLLENHKQNLPKKQQRSPWVFPKASNNKQAITEQYASQQVSQLAKGQWSAHDLRKLARTAWLELGVDYMIGEFLLNHKLNQVNQAYIQTFADEKCQEAINTWHQYLIHNCFPSNELNLYAVEPC